MAAAADSKALEKYKKLMEDLGRNMERLCQLEEDLVAAAARNDPEELNRLVKDAQPDMLTFRGLDQKRRKLEEQLGFQGLSLAEIVDRLPEEAQEGFSPLMDSLDSLLKRFRIASDNAEQIMSVRLNDIRLILAGMPEPDSAHSQLA